MRLVVDPRVRHGHREAFDKGAVRAKKAHLHVDIDEPGDWKIRMQHEDRGGLDMLTD